MAAQRPIWRGQLRLALVSCPIALYSANHDRGSLHFNLINPATGNRIRMITQDAESEEPLARRDLVKGYEFKKDTYLIMTDEDFESARVESSSTIKIDGFVDASAIDPLYYDSSYYVAPDGESGADVFAVLRDAIVQSGKSALSRVVIARRERAIAVMPLGRGLIAHTLHESRDLNDYQPLFDPIPTSKPDPDMIKLATQLIDRQAWRFDPAYAEDRYEAKLRAVIEAKLKGEGVAPDDEDDTDRSNVIDLMAALKQSLGEKPKLARKPGVKKPVAKKPGAKKHSPTKPTRKSA